MLVEEVFDLTYGARPLRQVMHWRVENAIAKRVLAGDFAEGDTVLVDHGPDGLTVARDKGGCEYRISWRTVGHTTIVRS